MNRSFKTALMNSGMSMYSLAKTTGLPYTTINRLVNDKLDINDCNAGSVYKLSNALGVTMEQLVTQLDFLTGTEGEYLGIKYKWTKDDEDHQLLILIDGEQEVVVWQAKRLLIDEKKREGYAGVVRLAIKGYREHKQSVARFEEVRKKYVRKPPENDCSTKHPSK